MIAKILSTFKLKSGFSKKVLVETIAPWVLITCVQVKAIIGDLLYNKVQLKYCLEDHLQCTFKMSCIFCHPKLPSHLCNPMIYGLGAPSDKMPDFLSMLVISLRNTHRHLSLLCFTGITCHLAFYFWQCGAPSNLLICQFILYPCFSFLASLTENIQKKVYGVLVFDF